MAKKKVTTPPLVTLVDTIIKGIEEIKGNDIVCLDLRTIKQSVCDYFIICDGSSDSQVTAIAKSVEEETRKALGEKPWHREGVQNAEWILIDYVSVVVHIFLKETRQFYNLEDLWADSKITRVETTY